MLGFEADRTPSLYDLQNRSCGTFVSPNVSSLWPCVLHSHRLDRNEVLLVCVVLGYSHGDDGPPVHKGRT